MNEVSPAIFTSDFTIKRIVANFIHLQILVSVELPPTKFIGFSEKGNSVKENSVKESVRYEEFGVKGLGVKGLGVKGLGVKVFDVNAFGVKLLGMNVFDVNSIDVNSLGVKQGTKNDTWWFMGIKAPSFLQLPPLSINFLVLTKNSTPWPGTWVHNIVLRPSLLQLPLLLANFLILIKNSTLVPDTCYAQHSAKAHNGASHQTTV